MVSLAEITQYFHWYGFIIGLSLLLGFWLAQKKAAQLGFKPNDLEPIFVWVLIGGLIGARVWHIVTDRQLYTSNPLSAFGIWEGGLSIFGAILGGMLALAMYLLLFRSVFTFRQLLDLAVFGLPFSQALGRVGNYVNQELYGPPSTLFWAIEIEEPYRLPEYVGYATYHPLFAYEMILMIIFGVAIWWLAEHSELSQKMQLGPIGSGAWFAFYILFYAVVRFSLDFIRLEKATFWNTNLGTNQVVMVVVAISAAYYLIRQSYAIKKE